MRTGTLQAGGRGDFCVIVCKIADWRSPVPFFRKRGGVRKPMGNGVPWKMGMLLHLPVTSRPLISLQKEAVLSPCNFATTHLTACILNFYLPSRPMKRITISQRRSLAGGCQLAYWRLKLRFESLRRSCFGSTD